MRIVRAPPASAGNVTGHFAGSDDDKHDDENGKRNI